MQRIEHPFLVSLHYAFESPRCFYFALTYAAGGDLTRWVTERLPPPTARTVVCEVLLALQYLHEEAHILYRDLKPENTLVSHDGHILLSDFGVSKRMLRETLPAESRTSSMRTSAATQVGTLDYMSPEQWQAKAYSYEVDYWALAVMLHELLTDCTVGGRSSIPIATELLDADACDLLRAMLRPERTERLGYGTGAAAAIKAHPYLAGVDWAAVLSKSLPGPFSMGRLTEPQEIGAAANSALPYDASLHRRAAARHPPES